MQYCPSFYTYQRRATREVMVGRVGVGGANPIRVQSMITCDTMDTEASIAQTMELAAVGCEIVRITAPTVKDSANLEHIVRGLRERGCDVPIVADIHFKPEAALEAAKWVEKVRINPGNYADSKKFKIVEYTDEQYAAELERIRERFTPLVRLCRERGIAMRIGTNHGSLSDRIMNRYGDTPLGMVESALEFARIARDLDYHAFVFSMKSSNPKVMINAYRLLVARLGEEGADWNYPIHLGVTEAGEGEDARIKSAIGIGSLLHDGIGDTIRVSLTEDSVHEIPVARALIEIGNRIAETGKVDVGAAPVSFNPFEYERRGSTKIERGGIKLGGDRIDSRRCSPGEFRQGRAQAGPAGRLPAGDRLRKSRHRGRSIRATRRRSRASMRTRSRNWSRCATMLLSMSSLRFAFWPRDCIRGIPILLKDRFSQSAMHQRPTEDREHAKDFGARQSAIP